jgi:hypothetical protein
LTISAVSQNPQVDDMTLAWGEGDPSLVPAAFYHDQRYSLALAVSNTEYNDTLYNFDRNEAWTLYEGLPISCFGIYRNRPHFGAGDEGYIVRMQVDDTWRDYDDTAIEAYWISKDLDLGYPLTTKSLLRYYVTGEASTAGSVDVEYGVERGTLTGATYSQNQSGFFRQVIKPSSLTYSEGIQHRIKISDETLDAPMSILSLTGRWNLNTNP